MSLTRCGKDVPAVSARGEAPPEQYPLDRRHRMGLRAPRREAPATHRQFLPAARAGLLGARVGCTGGEG